MNCDLNMMV